MVHARGGQRAAYQPIVTPLSPTSDPADVVAGLLRLHPFRRLYVADLDAIEGRGSHAALLADLARAHPATGDLARQRRTRHGRSHRMARTRRRQLGARQRITIRRRPACASLRDEPRLVLSLDFRGDTFQGPPEILQDPSLWPDRVIVMTLARVGAAAGPDTALWRDTRSARGQRTGLCRGRRARRATICTRLRRHGAAGALVATALHGGHDQRGRVAVARPACRPDGRQPR